MRRLGWVVVLAGIGIGAPTRGSSQTGYRAANDETSITPRESGFARLDFAEAGLSLQYVHEFVSAGIGVAPYGSAAARKGQFDVLSAFDFNPGFEAGVLGFVKLGGGGRALNVASLRAGFRNTQRKLFAFNNDSTTVALTESTQWDVVVATGLTLNPAARLLVGLGGSVRREWASPGATRAVEVCVRSTGPGSNAVPLCADRYPAPLKDHWAGQVRGDAIWDVLSLGRARSLPSLAMLGSASTDLGQSAAARLNAGAGVGVTTALYPGQPVVVLFFEMYDITDANGQALSFSDKAVIRLSLTIPVDLLSDR